MKITKRDYLRNELHKTQGGCCAWCGREMYFDRIETKSEFRKRTKKKHTAKQIRARRLTLDHVTPKSLGGGNGVLNFVAACRQCNSLRGNEFIGPVRAQFIQFFMVPA